MRVFSLQVGDRKIQDIDIFSIGGGADKAFTIESAQTIDKGVLSIKTFNQKDNAKLSAIEIRLKELHTAHAVAQVCAGWDSELERSVSVFVCSCTLKCIP